ncbi:hypothetical protein [Streptomyces acidiscabies]|uniref:hypothetical protein n=1 Tax=Streptomyces acidiscabies TaxID=42234 RepID=UPI0038F7007F
MHSGDLASAPAPDGATEYVDLDLNALRAHGVRYALPVVFSFNNIPFEKLLDAFAGFMTLPTADEEARGAAYDPRTVRQRYDLAGDSRIHVPMLVDLKERTFLWVDPHQYFASGQSTLWDLTVWHACARAREVAVIRRAPVPGALDELWHYRCGDGESATAFAARVRVPDAPDRQEPVGDADAAASELAAKKRVLLGLVHGGVAPEGASGEVYRLLPGPVDGAGLTPLAAGDLVAAPG